jgi:hypothetical protein
MQPVTAYAAVIVVPRTVKDGSPSGQLVKQFHEYRVSQYGLCCSDTSMQYTLQWTL